MQRHLVTSIFVFNPENQKFLMIKHKKVGKWLQPGGHLEKGEKPHEAALREAFEETGINVKIISKLAMAEYISEKTHVHVDFVYLACPLENQKETVNHEETDGLSWFSLKEILNESFDTFEDIKFLCKKIQSEFSS